MSFRAHLLLTRPLEQSQRFADQCRERFGAALDITISPLIGIEHLEPQMDTRAYRGFLFTSSNAVEAAANMWPDQRPHAYTVGERTARAARKLGYEATACGGDVTAMARHLRDLAPKGPLLHLRGRHSRGALARNLTGSGIPADEAVIYEQHAKHLSEWAKILLCGEMPVLLPLFSPRTATIFFDEGPDITAQVEAIVMSGAVAEQCKLAKERIHIAPRPKASAMIDCIGTVLSDL